MPEVISETREASDSSAVQVDDTVMIDAGEEKMEVEDVATVTVRTSDSTNSRDEEQANQNTEEVKGQMAEVENQPRESGVVTVGDEGAGGDERVELDDAATTEMEREKNEGEVSESQRASVEEGCEQTAERESETTDKREGQEDDVELVRSEAVEVEAGDSVVAEETAVGDETIAEGKKTGGEANEVMDQSLRVGTAIGDREESKREGEVDCTPEQAVNGKPDEHKEVEKFDTPKDEGMIAGEDPEDSRTDEVEEIRREGDEDPKDAHSDRNGEKQETLMASGEAAVGETSQAQQDNKITVQQLDVDRNEKSHENCDSELAVEHEEGGASSEPEEGEIVSEEVEEEMESGDEEIGSNDEEVQENSPNSSAPVEIVYPKVSLSPSAVKTHRKRAAGASLAEGRKTTSLLHSVPPEPENRDLARVEDDTGRDVDFEKGCEERGETSKSYSAPVEIIVPKVSFSPPKSPSCGRATLAALAKKRKPKRLQQKAHSISHAINFDMMPVVIELSKTKPTTTKAISCATTPASQPKSKSKKKSKKEKKAKGKEKPSLAVASSSKKRGLEENLSRDDTDIRTPAAKRVKKVHFSDVCEEHPANSEPESASPAPHSETAGLHVCLSSI